MKNISVDILNEQLKNKSHHNMIWIADYSDGKNRKILRYDRGARSFEINSYKNGKKSDFYLDNENDAVCKYNSL